MQIKQPENNSFTETLDKYRKKHDTHSKDK